MPNRFTRWNRGQPDNYKNKEDCLHLWAGHRSFWNDVPCHARFNYVCKVRYCVWQGFVLLRMYCMGHYCGWENLGLNTHAHVLQRESRRQRCRNLGPNIARGKRAYQSSTGWHGFANRATDGNENGHYGRRSCTHTRLANRNWLYIDLGATYRVNQVKLFNRVDCCASECYLCIHRIHWALRQRVAGHVRDCALIECKATHTYRVTTSQRNCRSDFSDILRFWELRMLDAVYVGTVLQHIALVKRKQCVLSACYSRLYVAYCTSIKPKPEA